MYSIRSIKFYGLLACVSVLFATTTFIEKACAQSESIIQPSQENPWYWQYEGQPVVLI